MLMDRLMVFEYWLDQDGNRYHPMIHQTDGYSLMRRVLDEHGAFGLLHDMGCGKTTTMITLLLELYERGEADSMFVACPSSVVGSWQGECERLNLRAAKRQVVALEDATPAVDCLGLSQASVPKREAALQRKLLERDAIRASGGTVPPLIVACNYESTWRMEGTLRAAHFDIQACDESQKIKAPGSKQSLAMKRIGSLAPLKILMTGTPVPEGGLDWYGQWRFARPELLGTNYGNFKAKYALEFEIQGANGKTFRKVSLNPYTKDELEAKVMPLIHRVSKDEAVDLPPETAVPIQFDLTPRQRRIYDDLVKDSIAFIERSKQDAFDTAFGYDSGMDEIVGDNVLTRMLRLQQICGGYMQVIGRDSVEPCDPKSNPKLAALVDLAETLRDTGKKLVVFHRFTHEGQAIVKALQRLSGKDRPVSIVNGSVSMAQRKPQIEEFQTGNSIFFVGQIQACAEGITLHAASDAALYSMPFSSGVYLQALARIHRIGQTHAVTYHHLLGRQTIDESVYESQMRKREASEDAIDGGWRRYFNGE